MVTVKMVRDFMNELAPFELKMDFDNVGLLTGFPGAEVSKAVAALDITDEVIEEAIGLGAELIVSHHPLIFHPLKRVTDDDNTGKKVIRLIQNHMSAICLHTNLDAAEGGVNDALMEALGANTLGRLCDDGIGRVGELPETVELEAFLARTKRELNCNALRYVSGGRPVRKLACCGGSGGGELERAVELGCDTYVTADIKYDRFLLAKELGLNLIDADHFCTENVVVPRLKDALNRRFPELDVTVSRVLGQTTQVF